MESEELKIKYEIISKIKKIYILNQKKKKNKEIMQFSKKRIFQINLKSIEYV
jgi:hypothetical protein